MLKTSPFPLTFLQDMKGLWGPRMYAVASQTFGASEVRKRVLNKTPDKAKAKPAFFIDTRTLDHRLNILFGGQWSVSCDVSSNDQLFVARSILTIHGIVREDISSELTWKERTDYKTNVVTTSVNELAATKAQASAYKRAAVKFGIGAYLYDFKDVSVWLPIDKYGKFKNPTTQPSDLPAFARPMDGWRIVMNELIYLCNTDDEAILKQILQHYWGLDSFATLNRDDSFRLAMSIARVSDLLEKTGSSLEVLLKAREDKD